MGTIVSVESLRDMASFSYLLRVKERCACGHVIAHQFHIADLPPSRGEIPATSWSCICGRRNTLSDEELLIAAGAGAIKMGAEAGFAATHI